MQQINGRGRFSIHVYSREGFGRSRAEFSRRSSMFMLTMGVFGLAGGFGLVAAGSLIGGLLIPLSIMAFMLYILA